MKVTDEDCPNPKCDGTLVDDHPEKDNPEGKYCPFCGWGLESEPQKIVCPECGQLLNVKIEDNGAIVCSLNGERT